MTRSLSLEGAAREGLALAGRLLLFALGLWVWAVGVVCLLRAELGLGPWDVFHQGLSRHLPITLGQASIAVSFAVVLASMLLGIRPGAGTVLNAFLIGSFIDMVDQSPLVPNLGSGELLPRLLLSATGVAIGGVGTAIYLKGRLGAGPRDGLMLGVRDRLRIRVGLARAGLELLVLACGWLLGGTAGVGTVIFALGIGPAVEVAFRIFRVKERRGAHHGGTEARRER